MTYAADLARLKRSTSSGFYCSKCSTRNRRRCRCRFQCNVCSLRIVRAVELPECDFGPRCRACRASRGQLRSEGGSR